MYGHSATTDRWRAAHAKPRKFQAIGVVAAVKRQRVVGNVSVGRRIAVMSGEGNNNLIFQIVMVLLVGALLGGCVGFGAGRAVALAQLDQQINSGPTIVCWAENYRFSYVPKNVETVMIYQDGRHSITVLGNDGIRRKIDSDDTTLICDAWHASDRLRDEQVVTP